MALISCPECGKEVSDRAPACIHCGYPLSSAAPYADFRPITGPNRFTVRLTARPAYPDARSRTLRALMKELGLSREQGIRLLEQARREPVPLREGLTEEEALALLEVFRRAGAPVQLVDAGAAPAPLSGAGRCPDLHFRRIRHTHRPGHLVSAESAVHQSVRLTGVSSKKGCTRSSHSSGR